MELTKRKNLFIKINDVSLFKNKILLWLKKFNRFCYLDSCQASSRQLNSNFSNFDFLLGVDEMECLTIKQLNKSSLVQLKNFHSKKSDWLFGFLSYDLKNEIENLYSDNTDNLNFPILHFFCPKLVFSIQNNLLCISYFDEHYKDHNIKNILEEINAVQIEDEKYNASNKTDICFSPRISKESYLETVYQLKKHIHLGDIYEINFCQEFYTQTLQLDPLNTYLNLKEISPTPFSAFIRIDNHYLLCASPERFLMKKGKLIISQPIKGTIKRGGNAQEDSALKAALFNDPKERSENVMIVDLVRNDLSKIAESTSVKVEEFCKIYSFEQVHQMISTVVANLHEPLHFTDAIKACFPMGSMTGAPKVKAMELIEKYECTKRGLFSGSVGYITPEGDFDFNVVIRSLFYNATHHYLSFMVGSAITDQSDPQKEYDECLLKAKALFDTLNASRSN